MATMDRFYCVSTFSLYSSSFFLACLVRQLVLTSFSKGELLFLIVQESSGPLRI